MNYKIATTVVGLATLIIPAGVALAKDGGQASGSSGGAGISQGVRVNLDVNLRGDRNENEHASTSADIEAGERGSATSTERSKEQRGEKERELHATTTASTSADRGKGLGRGGVPAFLRWLFGLPATTTVGDIRTAVQATTTASTTSPSQGLGFWAQLFGFLRLGKDN